MDDIENKNIKESIEKIAHIIKNVDNKDTISLIEMCLDDVRFLFKCKKGNISKQKTKDDYKYKEEEEIRCVVYENRKDYVKEDEKDKDKRRFIEKDATEKFNYEKMKIYEKELSEDDKLER